MKIKKCLSRVGLTVAAVLLLTVIILTPAKTAIASAEVIMPPQNRPAETEKGSNLISNGDFSAGDITRLDPSSGWSLPAPNDLINNSPAQTSSNILRATKVSDAELNPSEAMQGITKGLKLEFRGYNDPGDCLVYNGFGNVLLGSISKYFYFSAWVKTSVDIYFDVSIDSNDAPVADLGRRFKVGAADGWTEIGRDEDGNYCVMRTNAAIDEYGGTKDNQYKMTTSAKYAEKVNDDSAGEAYYSRVGSSWTALKITTHSAATGYADHTGGLTSGQYLITGVTFWAGEVVNKDEINELILEFDDMTAEAYTADSWAAYLAAYDETCDVYFDVNAKAAEVDAVAEKLLKARAKLVKIADKSDLKVRVGEAKSINDKSYTAVSYQYLEYAIETADSVIAKETASEGEVSAALALLDDAIDSLESKSGCGGAVQAQSIGAVLTAAALTVFALIKRKRANQEVTEKA